MVSQEVPFSSLPFGSAMVISSRGWAAMVLAEAQAHTPKLIEPTRSFLVTLRFDLVEQAQSILDELWERSLPSN